ncbi:hypothetical protein PoB_004914400 [Plakobranchus ocellatus]|uniref:Uncharacterized protein n=1 Tax=Plakobranchus ocellatus TaxID=259542 RepID=A0AAV4BR50_9GAST|nr:hypothetical protein PoB_004914400 [Plakobranchus ocellatus]
MQSRTWLSSFHIQPLSPVEIQRNGNPKTFCSFSGRACLFIECIAQDFMNIFSTVSSVISRSDEDECPGKSFASLKYFLITHRRRWAKTYTYSAWTPHKSFELLHR